jgi:hypothetical protein
MRAIGKVAAALLLLLMATGSTLAYAKVEAVLDRARVAMGDSLQLIISATDNDALEDLDVEPLTADFQVLGSSYSSSSSLSFSHRETRQSLTLELAPRREGTLQIPSLQVGPDTTPVLTVVVGPPPEIPTADESVIFELEVDRDKVYVQSQFVLTLRLQQSINLERRSISELKLDNAFVKPLEQRKFNRTINGRPWLVNEVRYAVFPEQSGILEIPAQQFSGRTVPLRRSLFDRGRSGQLVRRSTEPLAVNVLPKPDEFTAPTWLPVSELSVEESWSTPPEDLLVGESATRTITIRGVGAQGAQLPPVQFTPTDGLKYYPDQPRISEEEVSSGLLGVREDSAAMVPTRAGDYRIAEIRIPWWDVQSEQIRYAVVPERNISIAAAAPDAGQDLTASPAPTLESSGDAAGATTAWYGGTLLWPIVAAASTAGWLLTLVFLWRLRRTAPAKENPGGDGAASEKKAFKRLLSACAAGDRSAARSAVIDWAGCLDPARHPVSLEQVCEMFQDATLSQELEQLDASLYRPGDGEWTGSTLSDCLGTLRRTWRGNNKNKDQPLRLYPEASST